MIPQQKLGTFLAVSITLLTSSIWGKSLYAEDRDRFTSPPNFNTKEYVPLTTSRVIGAPETPPPFQVERARSKLKLTWPIFAITEPGSRRLMFIDQSRTSGPARLCRTKDVPATGEYESLWTFDGVAYDVTFHPDFDRNGYLYVGWNGPLSGDAKRSRVTRFTLRRKPPFDIVPKSEKLIIDWESDGHNGAAVAFGRDGMLYVTTGDGTSDSDTNIVGQGMDHLLGKVLRIDVDHPAQGKAYSVPADNPFVDTPGARGETWALGLRNPWRMAVDPVNGNLWVGNNGQDLWEQIYLVQRGDNYGWSVYEGSHPFYLNRKLAPVPHVKPTFEHHHAEARSLTGGVVYFGKQFPEISGAYIYGDYSTGKIWAAKHDGKRLHWHKDLADSTLQIAAFALDADGELLIVDHRGDKQGGFYRFVPNRTPDTSADFPRKLSETGLFRRVKGHVVEPALIPYSVNSPLWSDGAYKERYVALPGESPKISARDTRGWDFPDETVLVKSFAVETKEDDESSRRWIETRLLTKQQGEWVGYSYAWNEAQTDAVLVETGGLDREYRVQASTGIERRTWRFPSRSECMVCHSRAANFVLGLSNLQMNKAHDYGGESLNQIELLHRLGVLQINLQKTPIAELDRLVDPYDEAGDVNLRARSYLHANCAQCHVSAGGGNALIDLEFTTRLEKMNAVDVSPLHHKFELTEPKLIAPGRPESSVLLHRMAIRGRGQMPQLATSRVDDRAVLLLREWIEQMEKPSPYK